MLSNVSRWLTYLTDHSFAAHGLIVSITLAAFIYIGLFDLVARPRGLLYFLAYLAVMIPLNLIFRKLGTGGPT